MALLASPRVSGAILVDAVGIEVPGHPIADFFCLTMDEVFTLSFHKPRAVPHRPRHAAASRPGSTVDRILGGTPGAECANDVPEGGQDDHCHENRHLA